MSGARKRLGWVIVGGGVALAAYFVASPRSMQEPTVVSWRPVPTSPAELALAKAYSGAYDRGIRAQWDHDLRTAEAAFAEASRLRPNQLQPVLRLAEVHEKQGKRDKALAEYRVAVRGTPGSRCTEAQDPRVLTRYGDLLLAAGRKDEAREIYRQAVIFPGFLEGQISPRGNSLTALRAVAHYHAGVRLGMVGEEEAALAAMRRAVAIDPSLTAARLGLAQALTDQRRYGQARSVMAQADLHASSDERPTVREAFQALDQRDRYTIISLKDGQMTREDLTGSEARARAARP